MLSGLEGTVVTYAAGAKSRGQRWVLCVREKVVCKWAGGIPEWVGRVERRGLHRLEFWG